jgi:hypothetical protein
MGLVILETQYDFPQTDISDSNADLLELLLLHGETAELSHASAERVSYLYKIGHRALSMAALPHLDDDERSRAFSYGIATFEAVSALVRPQFDVTRHNTIDINFKVLSAHRQLDSDFIPTLTEARDTFSDVLPRTKQLVGQSATRFCRHYSDYAVTGAALAWQLEIDATAA